MQKYAQNRITIRPETQRDYKSIVSLVLHSFAEGTPYSDGTGEVALIEEIRGSKYYIPELSFVAELDGEIVGHFMFSHFPISDTKEGARDESKNSGNVMLAPVAVRIDHLREGIGTAMILQGIERVREAGFSSVTVEGNYKVYNNFGFKTSSEFGVYATSGYPLEEPRCMMAMELVDGALSKKGGFIVYDMYFNA